MANHPNRNAKGKLVVVNDGERIWVADKAALIAALDDLGWSKGRHLLSRSRTEPNDEAYMALCARVSAIDIEPTDEMQTFSWYPAEQAWLWS